MATLHVHCGNQACVGRLAVGDRRTIAPPIMIASHEAKFHESIDRIGMCPVAIHTGTGSSRHCEESKNQRRQSRPGIIYTNRSNRR